MGRTRTQITTAFSAHCRGRGGVGWPVREEDVLITDTATITDSVHSLSGLGRYDVGGPMDLSKTVTEVSPAYLNQRDDGWNKFFQGAVVPNIPSGGTRLTYDSYPSNLTLLGLGTTAVARVLPNNPSASLGQFLGEIRNDGLPHLPFIHSMRERTKVAKAAGSEYLNSEFGWKPFVSDLRKLAHSVKQSHKIVSQYVKGSDKIIRRGYSFPTLSRSNFTPCSVLFATSSKTFNEVGTGNLFENQEKEIWFRGAFKYHIPGGNDLPERFGRFAAEADKLLGIRPTPELVWNLSPWTWAMDWFGNTGDVIHNISYLGQDGMVMLYGYITVRDIRVSELHCLNPSSSKRVTSKRQTRAGAFPYGFGATAAELTASQEAVLVALGLSHGSR